METNRYQYKVSINGNTRAYKSLRTAKAAIGRGLNQPGMVATLIGPNGLNQMCETLDGFGWSAA